MLKTPALNNTTAGVFMVKNLLRWIGECDRMRA
jgi:hypothetical protein